MRLLSDATVTRGSWPAPKSTVTLVIQAAKLRRTPNGAPHENRVRGVLTDSDFNGTQVTYFVRLPDGAEMRVIVADPFAQEPVSLGTALDLYWSPRAIVLGACVGPERAVAGALENVARRQDPTPGLRRAERDAMARIRRTRRPTARAYRLARRMPRSNRTAAPTAAR